MSAISAEAASQSASSLKLVISSQESHVMLVWLVERKVTFHVEVDRDVPTDIEADDMQRMLANVFYGFSEDDENLVVNTVGLSTHARQEPILDDHFKRFIIHKDIRCVPNHDLLELVKGTTDEVRIERLASQTSLASYLPLL